MSKNRGRKKEEDEEMKHDEMIEQRLFSETAGSNTNRSPPPSRNVSPQVTRKTYSSLFGAMNSEEFNVNNASSTAEWRKEVQMLRD